MIYGFRDIRKSINFKPKASQSQFGIVLAAEVHKKYLKFPLKIFEVISLKLGATSNIIDELHKHFTKIKDT